MIPNIDELKESLKTMEKNINTLKIIINGIKGSLDNALRIFKKYHYIARDIIGNLNYSIMI